MPSDTDSSEQSAEKLYHVSFIGQNVKAKSIDEVIEKVNAHKDGVPFMIYLNDEQVAQWRKNEGKRIIEPMKVCDKHHRQLDRNGSCRDCK